MSYLINVRIRIRIYDTGIWITYRFDFAYSLAASYMYREYHEKNLHEVNVAYMPYNRPGRRNRWMGDISPENNQGDNILMITEILPV